MVSNSRPVKPDFKVINLNSNPRKVATLKQEASRHNNMVGTPSRPPDTGSLPVDIHNNHQDTLNNNLVDILSSQQVDIHNNSPVAIPSSLVLTHKHPLVKRASSLQQAIRT
jgi:hypothetical protein